MKSASQVKCLQELLVQAADLFPDKVAIIQGNRRYSYRELKIASIALARWLVSQNFSRQGRAAILSDDPFEYISSYFAILMAGGIAVGLNTQTNDRTLHEILNDCSAEVVFCQPKFRTYLDRVLPHISTSVRIVTSPIGAIPAIPGKEWSDRTAILEENVHSDSNLPEVSSADLAQIIYTSGTIGNPKGVMLTHSNLLANTSSIVSYLKLTANDSVMAVLPFFYSYGNSILLTHIAVGGTLVVNQNFLYPNVILDEMARERVTGFSGVTSTFAILLHRSALKNYYFPSLRYLTQAGAAMAPALVGRLGAAFPGVDIYIMYGQTEASARLSYLLPQDLSRKAGSIGKAIPGVTLQLLNKAGKPVSPGETGEIVAKGDNIMAGYWGKPAETAKVLRPEGLRTGDLARMDEEGYFYIVSRKTEMIKSGSHRIAPIEIEEVLLEHKAVCEVAVVGVADEILGETIKACVVLKDNDQVGEKDLIRHCRSSLAAFKVPHKIVFMEELPKTATGKIKKNALQGMETLPVKAEQCN